MEKRRKEAMEYLVRKYYESKIREEEFTKKLESYGRVRRWIHKRYMDLKDAGMILKWVVAKPAGITIAILSGWFSLVLAVSTAPKIAAFIDSVIPSPYNVVIDVVVCFPIGFSPLIIAESLYAYYVDRQIKKKLKEEYGIET